MNRDDGDIVTCVELIQEKRDVNEGDILFLFPDIRNTTSRKTHHFIRVRRK